MTTLGQALDELIATVDSRATADPATSYTAELIASGPGRCAKKLGEEAVEAALAAVSDTGALAEESADLLYHLIVTLKACNVSPSAIADALARRRAQSGLEEKANRSE